MDQRIALRRLAVSLRRLESSEDALTEQLAMLLEKNSRLYERTGIVAFQDFSESLALMRAALLTLPPTIPEGEALRLQLTESLEAIEKQLSQFAVLIQALQGEDSQS